MADGHIVHLRAVEYSSFVACFQTTMSSFFSALFDFIWSALDANTKASVYG
jgi:hypothetical protein